jgi:hypothetical protein
MPGAKRVVSDNSTLIMLLVALAAILFVFRKNLK